MARNLFAPEYELRQVSFPSGDSFFQREFDGPTPSTVRFFLARVLRRIGGRLHYF